MSIQRRDFIIQCGIISTGVMCGGISFLASGCVSYRQLAFTKNEEAIIITKTLFMEHNDGVLNYSPFPAPVYINKNNDGNYTAVLLECTHKGCEVAPIGNLLICPCHGSEFSIEGKVLQSPAEKDLYKFRIKQDNENLYINLN